MTEHVTIPASVEDAIAHLKGIDRLMTAKEWERAAIVAAHVATSTGQGARTELLSSEKLLTPNRFAEVGIVGLRSDVTIRRYVEAWQSTGRPRPKPGETVELPTEPFPPGENVLAAVKKNMKSVLTLLDDPEYVAKLVARMSDEAKSTVIEAIAKSKPQIESPAPTPPLPRPWSITDAKSKVLVAVESLIRDAIAAHPDGYGDSGESHAHDVGRYISELVAFCAWLLDPTLPYADPTVEHFDIAEGPLFVSDILGGMR